MTDALTRAESPRRQQAFVVLHQAGWSDSALAVVLRAHIKTIVKWREARGLTANGPGKIRHEEALLLHSRGASDGAIGRHFGVTDRAAWFWRTRRGLAPNFDAAIPYPKETLRLAKKMLKLGATMAQVQRDTGVGVRKIERLRKGLVGEPGLRPQGTRGNDGARRRAADPDLLRRIEVAIGQGIQQPYREDAVSALFVAVIEGRIAPEFIESQAPSFRSQALGDTGSKFGARSMSEELAEGWTLEDSLADPSALDDMEAAAALSYEMDW